MTSGEVGIGSHAELAEAILGAQRADVLVARAAGAGDVRRGAPHFYLAAGRRAFEQGAQAPKRAPGLDELAQARVPGPGDGAPQAVGGGLLADAQHTDAAGLEDLEGFVAGGDRLGDRERRVRPAAVRVAQAGVVNDEDRV